MSEGKSTPDGPPSERLYILATSLARVRAAFDIAGSALPFAPEARDACLALEKAADRIEAEWEAAAAAIDTPPTLPPMNGAP